MNTIDNLVIRACKSDTDISKRLVSLYKRFYIKPIPKNIDTQLCELLFNICEKHCPVSGQRLHKLIQEKVYHYSMYDTLKGGLYPTNLAASVNLIWLAKANLQ